MSVCMILTSISEQNSNADNGSLISNLMIDLNPFFTISSHRKIIIVFNKTKTNNKQQYVKLKKILKNDAIKQKTFAQQ